MSNAEATQRYFFTVREVREAHSGAGRHFFDRGTMRFFRSRICARGTVYGGRYFITSEKTCFEDYRRVYHVREVKMGGASIDTIGEYATGRCRGRQVRPCADRA